MRSNLRDVARLAGVSIATVSRHVNQSGFVSKQAAARIQAAVDELCYLPDLAAGSLVTRKSRVVAVLVPQLAQSMLNLTVESIIEALAEDGYTAMLGITGRSEARLGTLVNTAIARRAEGIILSGPILNEAIATRLRRANATVIETWGLPTHPIDIAVGLCHEDVGAAIAAYLAGRGYARPYLLTTRGTRAVLRRTGFIAEWQCLCGTRILEREVDRPSWFGQARGIFREMQALAERPDVVICGSDGLAQGMVIEALSAGLGVPEDLAVMGFGDLAIAAHMRPSLTTVAIDGARIGHEVADVLRARARGESPENRRIDVGFRLIERESA